jgi:PAS domain S-box-containing protein
MIPRKLTVDVMIAPAAFFIVHFGFVLSFSTGKIDIFKSSTTTEARVFHFDWKSAQEYAVSLLILGIFMYFMSYELHGIMFREDYAQHGLQNLVTAAVFGLLGLVAAGLFEDNSVSSDAKMKATQMSRNVELLRWATIGIKASHSAIAIVDRERKILLSNPAFLRLAGRTNEQAVMGCVVTEVLNLPDEDTATLSACFQETSVAETEFCIQDRIIHFTVTPSSSDAESFDGRNGFVVSLMDVTEERQLELTVKSAQEQASATRAAIEALAERMEPRPPPLPPSTRRSGAITEMIADVGEEMDEQESYLRRLEAMLVDRPED